jgi:hypothetical protein
MFDSTGVNYQYAELFGANKSQMESGASVTAYGFHNLTVGGVAVDTVQPVYTLDSNPPPSELFVNSFNINFGGGICNNGCSGLVVWALTKPGTPDTQLNGVVVSSSNYQLAPRADEPGCSQCIPTSDPPDTRITGTPVLNSGLISFALTTAINNGSQTVPGAFWGQINPVLNPDGSISSGSILQSGYFNYSGDGAATYPAMMPDTAGNLFMVFEFMNNNSNPSVAYVARRVTDPAGTFPDGGIFLKQGDAPTTDPRWGDYEAASYDGSNVWFAGEYSGSDGTWSTYIGEDHF